MANPTDSTELMGQVFHAPGDVRYEPVERPAAAGGDFVVAVEACAICGTDVKSFRKGNPRITPPQTMGHEFCGRVVETGPDADDALVGRRVTMATTIGCGECLYCRRGRTNLCRSAEAMGFHYPGAMAPRVRVPEKAVRQGHLVDVGDLPAELGALGEPLSCAINDLSRVPDDEVDSVLVVGLGPLGALHARAARTMGIANVCGVDLPGPRLQAAGRYGFDRACTPEEIDDRFAEWSGGEGFDLVVVTAPSNAAQAAAVRYARKGGYVSLFGSLPPGDEIISVNSRTVHYGELCVYGVSDSTPAHVARAVELLQANPEGFAAIVTHRLPLSEFHAGLEAIASGEAMKVVLFPEGA